MIASMTGFGRGSAQDGAVTATVEMRSVNNRFLDVNVRLPHRLSEREIEIQSLVKAAFDRGKVTVQVQIEQAAAAELPIRVNRDVARAYGQLLEDLRQAAGIIEPVRVQDLLNYSDVFTTAEEPEDDATEQVWPVLRTALAEAIDGLGRMRVEEGEALFADLSMRMDNLEATLARVEERAPERIVEARERMNNRLEELMTDERINPERLELEIALVAEKLDVTEECVRLHSHLHLFREALAGDEPVGRKLNFLVQEIHREVNTIGSKANDAEVGHLAVQMKEEVEKIREQIQNVE